MESETHDLIHFFRRDGGYGQAVIELAKQIENQFKAAVRDSLAAYTASLSIANAPLNCVVLVAEE